MQGNWWATETLFDEAWRGGYAGPHADEQDEPKAEQFDTLKFKIGDAVWIRGLSSPVGRALNGLSGEITLFDIRKDRYGVEIPGVGQKLLKAANLSKSPHQIPIVDQMEFSVGDTVFVHSLETLAGTRQNGSCGKVISFDARKGRYVVDIPDIGQKSIKAVNLTKRMDPAPPISAKTGNFEASLEEVPCRHALKRISERRPACTWLAT